MLVRMWEARAHPEGFAELLSWVCDKAVPDLEAHPLHVTSEVFSSTDHRVLVISRWRRDPLPLADPPRHLLFRTPHSWDFAPVDR